MKNFTKYFKESDNDIPKNYIYSLECDSQN